MSDDVGKNSDDVGKNSKDKNESTPIELIGRLSVWRYALYRGEAVVYHVKDSINGGPGSLEHWQEKNERVRQ